MRFSCVDVAKAALGQPKKQSGGELYYRCPIHDDHNPSLAINQKKDVWLCGPCNKGGTPWELAAFLAGYSPDDKENIVSWLRDRNLIAGTKVWREFQCAYIYEDEDRNPLFRVERYRTSKGKTFLQSRPDGNGGWISGTEGVRLVPYRLPDFINQDTVYIAEGEADADELWNWGLPATTNRTGAGEWKSEYNQYFEGKQVVLLPDQDPIGESHMEDVARNLFPVAKAVKIAQLPGLQEKGDFRDWKEAGGTLKQLTDIVKATAILTEGDVNGFDGCGDAHDKGSQNPWDKAISAPEFLASVDIEVDWLEENLLAPGAITEIFSPRGIGKSLAAHAFGIRLAKRGKRVLLADRDNPPREVKRRLKYWGAKDAPSFKVLTRDEVPPLTNKADWKTFPFRDYDLVIIDSFDSVAEGVGEQDSGKPSKAIASILDIAHRADGPAVLVLGNTVRTGKHSRGSGVIEDRADIVFEVRDATELKPSGTKDWWLELPAAGAEEWASRASRRKKRDRFKLAFIPSKFRVGEEPEPFILEVDLSDDPWALQDVTDEILQQGEEARAKAKQEREERREIAVMELIEAVKAGAEADDPLKTAKDAVPFLMERELRRNEARSLIEDRDGVAWRIETLNKQGRPKVLLPLGYTPVTVSKETAETNQDHGNPVSIGVSETHVSAAPMNTGRQKHGVAEPLLHKGFSEQGLFPPKVSDNPLDNPQVKNFIETFPGDVRLEKWQEGE